MTTTEENRIPETVKTIHLIAVCGTAMGALASLLKEKGFEVTGSDQKVYPPMSTFLMKNGIVVAEGYSEKNLSYRPDLVVVGNAVTKTNPEAVAMQDMGLCYCSMPQAINHFLVANKKPILITGTHGKTTTSSIITWILESAGLDPSFIIGGILKNYDSNYRLGKGEYIVIEGDEYDTAFFDKGPKFLHYDPHATVITGIEFDHADIFTDLNHVMQAFRTLISRLSASSSLIAFAEDENVMQLLSNRNGRVLTYGKSKNADWRLQDIKLNSSISFFKVFFGDQFFGEFQTSLMGKHNLLNSLAAIAIAYQLGINSEEIQKALKTFQGVKRRQEIRGITNGITVMDDFAHHPTAVKETIRAVKERYRESRLIAVFEPRTNTSMRNVFQGIYPLSFDMADLICIRKPPLLEKIPPNVRFSSEKLVQDLKVRGKDARYFEDTESIISFLIEKAESGDIVLIMSNGGFDHIHEKLLTGLNKAIIRVCEDARKGQPQRPYND